jgi:cytochrome c5
MGFMLGLEGTNMRKIAVLGIAALALGGSAMASAATHGEKVYSKTCTACHTDGLSGAPRLGNVAEWASRIPAGKEALVESVRKGKGLMPPRGGNVQFDDNDLRAAVEYILSKAR